ncbi:MAG: phage tail sheath subtilisin-like domain-containing protein [Candidatus Bathyarchaeia archaeon]
MNLARILPGVEIKVVKEIVPQQLHPSGIVGLVGTAEKGPILMPTPVTSYRAFKEKFGSDTTQSLIKEARVCFLNGVFEVFATRIEAAGSVNASVTLKNMDGENVVRLEAIPLGEAGNKIKVGVTKGTVKGTVAIQLANGVTFEVWDNVVMDRKSDSYLVSVLNSNSKLVSAKDLTKPAKPLKNPLPAFVEETLAGGFTAQPAIKDYEAALETFEMEPDIDMVSACNSWDPKVHALVDAHCTNMSKDAKNRIGIGTVAPGESIEDITKRTDVLATDRFVLVAPYGCSGAVAGLISKLDYYESPTFKALTGVAELEVRYTPSQLMELLKAGILALEARRGRGIIVEKGISTSKEQISVTRIADHAVRGARNVCENFIGTLNTAGGRTALRQKLTEFLMRMEREEAVVPSVDGTQPPFLVDVYSSQLDFAQGIVRVDIAVRPVRAMDYIYATITVQA